MEVNKSLFFLLRSADLWLDHEDPMAYYYWSDKTANLLCSRNAIQSDGYCLDRLIAIERAIPASPFDRVCVRDTA